MKGRHAAAKAKWLLLAVVIVASFGTRLYRIGWSYWYDEIPTFSEIDTLFRGPLLSKNVPADTWAGTAFVLTRVMPVGYALNGLTRHLVGDTESKVRLGVAFSGAAAIVLIFLLGTRLYGVTFGVLLAGILLVWPWHLFHSQSFRSYSYAHLFMSVSLLTFALAVEEKKAHWGILSGVVGGLAIFTHAVCSFMVGLCVFYALARVLARRGRRVGSLWGYLLSVLPFVAGQILILASLLPGAAMAFSEGYTVFRNVSGFVFNLGWPVLVLYLSSWVLLLMDGRTETETLWAFLGCGLLFMVFAGPRLTPTFRPDYLFAMCLPVQVLASKTLQRVVECASSSRKLFACAFAAGIVLMPLPSTVSYYLDGKRADYRAAGQYISRRVREGDVVVAESDALLQHYLKRPVVELRESELAALGKSERCWVVLEYGRAGIRPEIEKHLTGRATRVARIRRQRFDYEEYAVDIFLFDANACPMASPPPAG